MCKALILRSNVRIRRQTLTTIRYELNGQSGFAAADTPYVLERDDCLTQVRNAQTVQMRIPHGAFGFFAPNSGDLLSDQEALGAKNNTYRVSQKQQGERFHLVPALGLTDNDGLAEPVIGAGSASAMMDAPVMQGFGVPGFALLVSLCSLIFNKEEMRGQCRCGNYRVSMLLDCATLEHQCCVIFLGSMPTLVV